MSKINKLSRLETVCKWFLIAAIFLYPFICSFIGIDLGDTGYHLYAFENFFADPDKISFTSFFTKVLISETPTTKTGIKKCGSPPGPHFFTWIFQNSYFSSRLSNTRLRIYATIPND